MRRWAAMMGVLALLAVSSALQPTAAQGPPPDMNDEHGMHQHGMQGQGMGGPGVPGHDLHGTDMHGTDMHPGMPGHGPGMGHMMHGFMPGLGEIMAAQQMRHAKLWFAGSAANWPLAAYEVSELKEGFDQAASLHPMHEDVDVAKLLPLTIARPLEDLAAAIRGKDAARFRERYDLLTAACNACHQAAHHGFIVIQRPAAPPFTNQVYTPPKP